jgi:hypothetical protein
VAVSREQVKKCAQHRAARRRALQRGRVNPLPPLPAQLHTAGHGTRSPARPPLIPVHPARASCRSASP